MSMVHWWNDTNMGDMKYLWVVGVGDMSLINFVHHSSHMEWPRIEHGPHVRGW
jgi:hypothetical protein